MGERKGTNLYYPPDYNPKAGGLNKFMGTHALRERARKLHEGILIIRFEMPFNIWCDKCNNHIGMGVRYNAEKKKIGMYYTTPLYQFRMKCHLCDNHFEIKTDPGNLTYVIESGARRQENRWDPIENEQVVPETKEVSNRLHDDAMYKLEHGVDDTKKARSQDYRLNKIIAVNNLQWKDDFSSNCALRDAFRKKKNNEKQQKNKSLLITKVGVNFPLIEENKDDIQLAQLLMKNKNNDKRKKLPHEKILSHLKLTKKNKLINKRLSNDKKIISPSVTLTKANPEPSPCKSLVDYGSSSDSDEK